MSEDYRAKAMSDNHFRSPYPDGLPIGPDWLPAPASNDVVFPYDGSLVATAPVADAVLAAQALDQAAAIAATVGRVSSADRRAALDAVHRALAAHTDELVRLLVLETGKPLVDCRTEVARTLTTWSATAEEVSHIHGETVPVDLQPTGVGMLGFWTRRPAGPVVGIAGFNYPLLLASHKVAPAIAAGCPIIVKPAPGTPLATLWMVHLIRLALADLGLPAQWVQLVTGDAEVGSALVTDPRVAVVSFTGSAAVGHRIARDAAPRRVVLELGSNAALLVTADADLDKAAGAVVRGGFYANGQACIAIQRIIVAEQVAAQFEELLAAKMAAVRVGDPREESTRVAPLIDERSTARVLEWIEEAVAAGGRVVHGGGADGRSITPTVLAQVPADSRVWREEVFGPVVCLTTVPDFDTALNVANDSRYGLQAAVFTASLATALRAVEELQVGGVVVNEVPGFRSDIMPYGGVKDSGIGREGPRFAIEEYTVTKMALIRPA